jgi:hypothetical protein
VVNIMERRGFVYVIHVREFLQQDVYKVGRTRDVFKRFKQYPRGSRLLYCQAVEDMFATETSFIRELRSVAVLRKDIGTEYFEGERRLIVETVHGEAMKEVVVGEVAEDLPPTPPPEPEPEPAVAVPDPVPVPMEAAALMPPAEEEVDAAELAELTVDPPPAKIHKCKRCGYHTLKISHLKQHLQKTKPCSPLLCTTSTDALLEALKKPDHDFTCGICNQLMASKFSLQRHTETCERVHKWYLMNLKKQINIP